MIENVLDKKEKIIIDLHKLDGREIVIDPNGGWVGEHRPRDQLILRPLGPLDLPHSDHPSDRMVLDVSLWDGQYYLGSIGLEEFTKSFRILHSEDAEIIRDWLTGEARGQTGELSSLLPSSWDPDEWLQNARLDEIENATPEELVEEAEQDKQRIIGGVERMRKAQQEMSARGDPRLGHP